MFILIKDESNTLILAFDIVFDLWKKKINFKLWTFPSIFLIN